MEKLPLPGRGSGTEAVTQERWELIREVSRDSYWQDLGPCIRKNNEYQ